MANLNKVLLMGNLVRDPELRHTPSGAAVCDFTIALNRDYKQGEEMKKEVAYVKIITWGKLAKICSEYLSKGRAVFVEGRLQSRSWKADDGTNRSATEIVAQNIQFMGKRPEGQKNKESEETDKLGMNDAEVTDEVPVGENEVPF